MPLDPVLAAVLAKMTEHADAIADETAGAVHRIIPAYHGVTRQSLAESALRNHARTQRALREGHGPSDDDMIEEAWVVRERVHAGVPIENVLHAYRLSITILRNYFTTWAVELGLDNEQILRGVNALWGVTDVVTLRMAAVHREEELEIARHDERQRFSFLQGLLTGAAGPEQHLLCATYGLPAGLRYFPIRARITAGHDLPAFSETLPRTHSGRRVPTLLGIFEGDIAGITAEHPELPDTMTAAVGPRAALTELAGAFRRASHVLDVGLAFGLRGALTEEKLPLRLAVAAEDDVGALLLNRYVTPLQSEPDHGTLLEESIRAYLAANRIVRDAARQLLVHPNTLRYRIRKFESLTEADLTRDRTAFEVWWALERLTWDREKRVPPDALSPVPGN